MVNPSDVYWLEAAEGGTRVHLKGSKPTMDLRPIGLAAAGFESHGFLRVHRCHMVNLRLIKEIRRRSMGRDWEIKLVPPMNRVLPVGREYLADLWGVFDDG